MGMETYKKNTGMPHSLSGGIKTSESGKRDTSTIRLTNEGITLWYGTISVGTPPVNFTGIALSFGYKLSSDTVESSEL